LKKGEVNNWLQEMEFMIDEKRGLVYQNMDVLAKQRGVMSHFLKQAGLNLMRGKSIMDISLPVTIFMPKSYLEIGTNFLRLAPLFVEKAAEIEQVDFSAAVERMKYIVSLNIAMLHVGT
jgi:hypothetical protein